MLALRDVDVSIQASHILRKVSLDAAAGELVCLVGRNGAGKTTTLRTVMGYTRPSPAIIPQLAESIAAIARLGPAILVAESNIHHVPASTTRLYVIERGEIVFA